MTLLAWPMDVLPPETLRWRIRGGVAAGPTSLSGMRQTGYTGGGGIWTLNMTRVLINTPQQVLVHRALESLMDQGATPIVIELPDYGGIWRMFGNTLTLGGFGDGAIFGDSSLFATGALDVETVGDAVAGDTSLRLLVNVGPAMDGGYLFSVIDTDGYPRRHQIGSAVAVDGFPGQYDVKFRPPLRTSLASGSSCNLNSPGSTMKLADPESLAADLMAARFGECDPSFEEYMARPADD